MALKFLNKKGWHTGSLRNIETVWKAEQKHGAEEKKLEELRKQIQEERERAEFRQLQESAGLVPRQERLDFLYESGLGVGKGSSEGFKALQAPTKADETSAADAPSTSSKPSAPGALFEDKPQSANDSWRKLHSDPLLLIRQREQEALARIRSNPVQMAMIRKSVEAEKTHKEKGLEKGERRKKKHKKKHQHKKSKHDKYSHAAISDSDLDSPNEKKIRRTRDNQTYKSHVKDGEKERMRNDSTPEPIREMGTKRHRERRPHEELKNARYEKHSSKSYSDSEQLMNEVKGKHKKNSSKLVVNKQIDDRKNRDRSPFQEVNKETERRTQRDHSERKIRQESRDGHPSSDKRSNPYQGSEYRHNAYNHRRSAPKISEEERAAKLREMQENADLHEEQRWKRLKRASEVDILEANKDKPSLGGRNFLDAAHKSIYGTEKGGSSTIEESVRRRTYFSQGGTAANESNAFRR